jgi:hypothetical protein
MDIYFAGGRKPSCDGKELPGVVFVDIPAYCGPLVVPCHPHLVPIGPREFADLCHHESMRVQFL